MKKFDVARVMLMCLIHDVVEIDAGEILCYDAEGYKTQKAREEAAKERLYSMLPEDQKADLVAIFDECRGAKDPGGEVMPERWITYSRLLLNHATTAETGRITMLRRAGVRKTVPDREGSRSCLK